MPVQVINCGTKEKEDADFPSVRNFHTVRLKNENLIHGAIIRFGLNEAKTKIKWLLARILPLIKQNLL
ncbi:hypothetical protein D3C85_1603870 [compost metagenome]